MALGEYITIKFNTDTPAFEDTPATEVGRILRDLAERFEQFGVFDDAELYDTQGNLVGIVEIELS